MYIHYLIHLDCKKNTGYISHSRCAGFWQMTAHSWNTHNIVKLLFTHLRSSFQFNIGISQNLEKPPF